jgi:type IV secretory pathway protease TraF
MPRGIYIKISKDKFELRDIVVSQSKHFRGNLLKYIAAASPSEVCITDGEAIFVDSNFLAQPNIEKYPISQSPQCRCEKLKPDELLIIGDHPDSYDSRYFGPIKIDNVIATVELLWEFKNAQ